MAESCSLSAHVRNSKGEEVESKLFNDLLHFTSNNRGLAKEYYGIGINQKFLDLVSDDAKFDENGEITINSLIKLANIDLKKESILNTLNKDIKAGNYSYDEAIVKLQDFNRNNQFKDNYLATIESDGKGNYKLSVVERNSDSEGKLYKEISNRSLQDRVKFWLNKNGVSVGFLNEDEKVDGRYSTKNAEKTVEGLYQLIKIAHGEKVESTLCEEAGHFAVGALGDSPLVTRLQELMTPEVQKEILGEDKYIGDSGRREAAGTLVGRALYGEVDKRAVWQSLVNRISDMAKRVFYRMKGDEVRLSLIEARNIADKIASGFMSPDFKGTLENALNKKETLYNAEMSFNVKTFKDILNRVKLLALQTRTIDKNLYDKYKEIIGDIETHKIDLSFGGLNDQIAIDGITEALVRLSDLMVQEIPDLLESVDFNDTVDFNNSMVRNSQALQLTRFYLRDTLAIIDIINNVTSGIKDAPNLIGERNDVRLRDDYGNVVSYNLEKIAADLNTLITQKEGVLQTLQNKEREFYVRFLESSLGSTYINRAKTVLFNWNSKKGPLIQYQEAKTIKVSDVVNHLEYDITQFERFLSSSANSSDLVTQISDKIRKTINKLADDRANEIQDRLRIVKNKLQSVGVYDTDIFYEKSNRTGKITGNLISDKCWGDWEDDLKEFKKQCREEFKAANPNLDTLTDFQKSVLWGDFFYGKNGKLHDWHKGNSAKGIIGHSVFDNNLNRWVPNDSYKNQFYTDNIDIAQNKDDKKVAIYTALKEFLDIKRELDSLLPDGSTTPMRAPQFKGTFTNKIRNRRLFENTAKAATRTTWESLKETFCEDSEDYEYGSAQTYNSLEEDIFGDALSYEKEKINRIPLYGINKMPDMSQLSTDLYYSLFAYAGMATNYSGVESIVGAMEVGKQVLLERSVGGIKREREREENKSRAYNRYLKFLEKQVYGVGLPKHKIGAKIVIGKIASLFTRMASKYFLGGNVAGGMVNTGTGTIEVFKEALAGEHFTMKDWEKAHEMYFSSFANNWMHLGTEFKNDKVNLLIRHFNILSENKMKQRDWHTNDWRIFNLFGESLYLPYKSGDHYMQSIAYLALLNHIKVYDSNGNKISLYNAYEKKALSYKKGDDTIEIHKNTRADKALNLIGVKEGEYTVGLKEGKFFKSNEDRLEYQLADGIFEKVKAELERQSTGLLLTASSGVHFTQEELDYLNENNVNIADLEQVKSIMNNKLLSLPWNSVDESAFMDKAREINNRMHGIYNEQDKTAFQQDIYGNMVLAMRGYALGMIERRFGANKYSVALGGESEGSLRTMAKVITSTFMDRGGFTLTARALFLPFSRATKQKMTDAGFSENQYYNMRRNLGDFLFIAALTILKMMTARGADDDDDDDEVDQSTALAYYFSTRLLREQMAFNTFKGLSDEMPTLTSLTPVGLSALIDIQSIVSLGLGSTIADETDSDYFYQSSKEGDHEKYDPKWEKKFMNRFPYLRFSYVLNNPYEAASGFEYGRKVRK